MEMYWMWKPAHAEASKYKDESDRQLYWKGYYQAIHRMWMMPSTVESAPYLDGRYQGMMQLARRRMRRVEYYWFDQPLEDEDGNR